jgi:hypothetical protein
MCKRTAILVSMAMQAVVAAATASEVRGGIVISRAWTKERVPVPGCQIPIQEVAAR